MPVNAAAPALAKETASEFDYAQRDQVVLDHLPLVRSIAARIRGSLPVHVELDDLVHAGVMGLIDAATKYNSGKNVVFVVYAKHRIRGAILDSLRQIDVASRDLRRQAKRVEAIRREMTSELHRNPTDEEIAARLGIGVGRWRQMMVDLRNVGLMTSSSRQPENDDLPPLELPAQADSQPEQICVQTQIKDKLGGAIRSLPERYQTVVMMYYSNDMTMKEIGNLLGINESRVSQIHKAALGKMQVALIADGISSAAALA